jgi:hypothetical protein
LYGSSLTPAERVPSRGRTSEPGAALPELDRITEGSTTRVRWPGSRRSGHRWSGVSTAP